MCTKIRLQNFILKKDLSKVYIYDLQYLTLNEKVVNELNLNNETTHWFKRIKMPYEKKNAHWLCVCLKI